MITMKGNYTLVVCDCQAWALMLFCCSWCHRIPLLTEMELKALIEAEMKAVKNRLFIKRRRGLKKHIGGLPSMKYGKLFAEAETIVLARLAGGGVESASSSSIDALPSPASSPPPPPPQLCRVHQHHPPQYHPHHQHPRLSRCWGESFYLG